MSRNHYDSAAAKERYRARLAEGICGNCGVRPAKPGYSSCRVCLQRYHDSYERNKRGDGPGIQGLQWRFSVTDGDEEVFRGTAREVAERFGVKIRTVYESERLGRRFRKYYSLHRRRIGGDGDV